MTDNEQNAIDEKQIIRIRLGYLATAIIALCGSIVFLVTMRTDVTRLLDLVINHQKVIEEQQRLLFDFQYKQQRDEDRWNQFMERYEQDANKFIRNKPLPPLNGAR